MTEEVRPAAGARAALVVYHRDGVKVVPLVAGAAVVVGRTWPSDVVVGELGLSRQHARFTWSDAGVEVEDLGSTNGTHVRGQRVERAQVAPGETVMLGAIAVVVQVSGEELRGIEGHERFSRRLEEEVTRARTFGRRFAVIMVRVLDAAAEHPSHWALRLRGALRAVDHMALYGPGAALVLLPETDRDEAKKSALGLVQALADDVSIACGVATWPDASTTHELIDHARQAARRAAPAHPVELAQNDEGEAAAPHGLVLVSPKMRELFQLVERVANSSIPVLILGETGVGKEVLARAIHEAGPRRDKPMRCINCAAIPATLIESVLFGHEKGAFTGADRAAPGLFEQAAGGTVLLDEIGELSAQAQAALLRVLETKRVTRVGAGREIEVSIRVIAATHRDLEQMVGGGGFRADLYYRLNTMTLRVPSLRERPEEIPILCDSFLAAASRESGREVRGIDPEARAKLVAYSWPGNVRELKNVIERAVVVCAGDTIGVDDLSERVRGAAAHGSMPPSGDADASGDADFNERVRKYETELMLDALRKCGGNQTEAARLLRMPLRTLVHKLKAYGIRKTFDAR